MPDDVSIDISPTSSAEQLARDWPELGFDEILAEEVDEVARLGLSALKSKVPIKTGELRNEQIQVYRANDFNAKVYISKAIHESSNGSNPPAGNVLAALLNLVKYKRSQTSLAEDGFAAESGTTNEWIGKALSEFDRRL